MRSVTNDERTRRSPHWSFGHWSFGHSLPHAPVLRLRNLPYGFAVGGDFDGAAVGRDERFAILEPEGVARSVFLERPDHFPFTVVLLHPVFAEIGHQPVAVGQHLHTVGSPLDLQIAHRLP